jgi:hypothetical protein
MRMYAEQAQLEHLEQADRAGAYDKCIDRGGGRHGDALST